ncbi:MAG TPA: ATP-dependent DNA ligase [Candidatus Nanopelagicaceae bacterium]|nr:ATP-dependent DNA ligase [Candidatus Nanopelagicaceae bacterium]
MRFEALAILFSELEATTKRLEMTDILSSFFENIKKSNDFKDLDKIIYLLQGQLVSNIKQFPKIGIAENTIIEALNIHSTIKKEKIKEILRKTGDIGATAEFILNKKNGQKYMLNYISYFSKTESSLEISELYNAMQKIAYSEGTGSHDTKIGILRELMSKTSPLETKYLLRIITSTLRVGVSTMTIIDGLALGFTGERKNRDSVEKAFNLHPDLGDITIILAENGISAVEKIDIEYGVPIRMMLASRVPYGEIIEKLGSPLTVEYKLDGERLQIHKEHENVKLFSRRLLNISEQYPDVCRVINENISANNVIMEGEVVAMDPFYEKMLPFQVLSKRRRKHDIDDIMKEVPVCLFLFDILKCENESYLSKSFLIRRKKLGEIVTERDELRLVKSKTIKNTEEMLDFFNEARREGNEGIMAKSIKDNSVYQAGNRGFLWIKLKGLEGGKLKDSVDVVLVGAFHGKGRRTGSYGTYIGAVYDPISGKFIAFTRFFSGLTDELSESLTKDIEKYIAKKKPNNVICEDKPDVWLEPEVVIEIIGDEITISEKFLTLGYSMRFPVFQKFRPEKGPEDITTVNEIDELYKSQ